MGRIYDIDYDDAGVKAFNEGDSGLRNIRMLMRSRKDPVSAKRCYSERKVDQVIKRCAENGLLRPGGAKLAVWFGGNWVADPAELRAHLDYEFDWENKKGAG